MQCNRKQMTLEDAHQNSHGIKINVGAIIIMGTLQYKYSVYETREKFFNPCNRLHVLYCATGITY